MTLRVLVCGGTGVFGSLLIEALCATHEDLCITVASRTSTAAFPHLSKIILDLGDLKKFVEEVKNHDVVVIAAGPFQTLSPELARMAAESKVHYIDLCDHPPYFFSVWQQEKIWHESGRICLTGLSSLPGISLPLVKIASARFEKISEIKIGLFIGNANRKGRGAVFSALQGLDKKITVIANGEKVQKEAWSETECFEYPQPIGKVPSSLFSSPDPELINQIFGVPHVSVRVGFEWGAARFSFRIFKWLARAFGYGLVRKIVNIFFPFFSAMHAFGTERGSVTVLIKGQGKNGPLCLRAAVVGEKKGQRMASLPAALAILALARGEITKMGLQNLDAWIAPEIFLERLRQYGFEMIFEEMPCT